LEIRKLRKAETKSKQLNGAEYLGDLNLSSGTALLHTFKVVLYICDYDNEWKL